jgi:hypothetical protein
VAFITFWEHWCFTNETHCHIWWESKLYIFIKEHNRSLLTLSISRFINSWCERRLKNVLLSWCIATQRIWLQIFRPRHFLLTSMNIGWVWLSA